MFRKSTALAVLAAAGTLAVPAVASAKPMSVGRAASLARGLAHDGSVARSEFRGTMLPPGMRVLRVAGHFGGCGQRLGRHAFLCRISYLASYGSDPARFVGVLVHDAQVLVYRPAATTAVEAVMIG